MQKRMGGDTYMAKVSTMALCSLTFQCLANIKSVRSKATVDAHWVCKMTAHIEPISIGRVWYLYIHVWASALLDLDRRAMRDALERGTGNRYSDPHFLFICTEIK